MMLDDLITEQAARRLADNTDTAQLMAHASAIRDARFGDIVTVSRKVFIPLTQLCRDVCHYCTFARPPREGSAAFLDPEAVLAIARAGASAGCDEALFTLGDRPEARWSQAAEWLERRGFASTLDYLRHCADLVLRETGLLPHLNAGVMCAAEIGSLRPVAASMGLMLETISQRLAGPGGPHFGSPDKHPARRLATIDAAGRAAVPFTSGLLIGIGETRAERIDALLALRRLHLHHGHLQEIIIQPFRAKPRTRMRRAPEPDLDELVWTIAVARIVFGPLTSIQSPPNLAAPGDLPALLRAGIDDWGGVSPVTPDHVNPEKPWPALVRLAEATASVGKHLAPRLAVYPTHLREPLRWLDPALRGPVLRRADATGLAREDDWHAGRGMPPPPVTAVGGQSVLRALDRVVAARVPDEADVAALFSARHDGFVAVCQVADALRRETCGDTVTYVVNRNINYTNVCAYTCRFCAFSKGRGATSLRGPAYDLDEGEIARRSAEAWSRGATEVCLQGGIHPDYTGDTYRAVLRAVRAGAPGLHIHAFSPLEIWQGAATTGRPPRHFLALLRDNGLGTLPGTAAEILDDEIRAIICPDKLTTAQWFEVMRAAHDTGLCSTATIMFGHVEAPIHWARHLLRLRSHQQRSLEAGRGAFTEFVPLPFVAAEAPIYRQGRARSGPTWREAVLMHAVGRIVLHGLFRNIQASWVKLGPDGAARCLSAGANDLGGTLMNESITRAAGAAHGQEFCPERMEALIRAAGRAPRQRTTTYGAVTADRVAASMGAPPLAEMINPPAGKRARLGITA